MSWIYPPIYILDEVDGSFNDNFIFSQGLTHCSICDVGVK